MQLDVKIIPEKRSLLKKKKILSPDLRQILF